MKFEVVRCCNMLKVWGIVMLWRWKYSARGTIQ